MYKTLSIVTLSVAITMLWLDWALALQAILVLFAFGSFVFHVWLSIESVLKRLREREEGLAHTTPIRRKEQHVASA